MGSEVIPQGATGVRETLSTEDFKGRRTFKCSYINSLWAWPPTPLGAQYRKNVLVFTAKCMRCPNLYKMAN